MGWCTGGQGVLDVLLHSDSLGSPLPFGGCSTPLTHAELTVGETLRAPSGTRPVGFGASVPDSTFARSCFILLDLAPCSRLGRSSLDPSSLPGPRPLCRPAPGLLQFPSAARRLEPLHSLLQAAWPRGERPQSARTQVLFESVWQAGLESWLPVGLLGGLGCIPAPPAPFPYLKSGVCSCPRCPGLSEKEWEV